MKVRMDNPSTSEEDGLHHQKITSDSNSVIEKQKSEVAVGTDSPSAAGVMFTWNTLNPFVLSIA